MSSRPKNRRVVLLPVAAAQAAVADGLASRRDLDGLQTHRVDRAPLACRNSPDPHLPVCSGAAVSCTVTQSPQQPGGEGEGSVVGLSDAVDDCQAEADTCVAGAYAFGATLKQLDKRAQRSLG